MNETIVKKIIFHHTPTQPQVSMIFMNEAPDEIKAEEAKFQMTVDGQHVQGGDKFKGELIIDMDKDGRIVSIEILGDVIPKSLTH